MLETLMWIWHVPGGSSHWWLFKTTQLIIDRILASGSRASSSLCLLPSHFSSTWKGKCTNYPVTPEPSAHQRRSEPGCALWWAMLSPGVSLRYLLSLACRLYFLLWIRSGLNGVATWSGQRHWGARQCVQDTPRQHPLGGVFAFLLSSLLFLNSLSLSPDCEGEGEDSWQGFQSREANQRVTPGSDTLWPLRKICFPVPFAASRELPGVALCGCSKNGPAMSFLRMLASLLVITLRPRFSEWILNGAGKCSADNLNLSSIFTALRTPVSISDHICCCKNRSQDRFSELGVSSVISVSKALIMYIFKKPSHLKKTSGRTWFSPVF